MVGVVENQPDFAAYIRTNGQTSLFLIDLKARSEMYASSQGVKDDILKFKTIMQGYCGSNSFRGENYGEDIMTSVDFVYWNAW